MKTLLSKRVPIAWLLVSLILSAATVIVGIAFLNAPPTNSVIIDSPTQARGPAPTAVPNGPGPAATPESRSTEGQARGPAATRPPSTPIAQAVGGVRESPLPADSTPPPPASGSVAMSQSLDPTGIPPGPLNTSIPTPAPTPAPTDTPQMIAVHVSGAVSKP